MCIWSLRQTNSGCIRCVYGHCGRPTVAVSDVYMVIAADQQWLYQMCIWSLRQTNSGCIEEMPAIQTHAMETLGPINLVAM